MPATSNLDLTDLAEEMHALLAVMTEEEAEQAIEAWPALPGEFVLDPGPPRGSVITAKIDRWPGNSQAPAGAYTMYGSRP